MPVVFTLLKAIHFTEKREHKLSLSTDIFVGWRLHVTKFSSEKKKHTKTVKLSFSFHPVLIFVLKIRAVHLPPSPQAGIPLFFSGPSRVTALSAPQTATWLKEIFQPTRSTWFQGEKLRQGRDGSFELLVRCLFGAPAGQGPDPPGTQQALMLKVP